MKRALIISRGPDGRVKIQKMDDSERLAPTPAPQTAHQK